MQTSMQFKKKLIRYVRRPIALALAVLALAPQSSKAVDFNVWVLARGQTWALLVPGSGTGGRVVWSSAYGCNITDRAARGEWVCPSYWATAWGEYTTYSQREYTCTTTAMGLVSLPGNQQFQVSTNPNCDSLHVSIWTNCDYKRKRIPLGSR
jgi:hypothetical protein